MEPFKRKNSPYWWYNFTVDGIRFRESTKTTDKELAKAIISKAYNAAFMQKKFGKKEDIQLRYAFGKYYNEHAIGQTWANSVHRYLECFGNFWGLDTILSQITNKEFGEAVQHLKTKHLQAGRKQISGSTINRYISAFRKMYNLAKDMWGVNVSEINFKMHWQREPDARDRWATPEEIQAILAVSAPHLQDIIQFALFTGVRASNNLNLKWSQVDFKNRTLSFRVKQKNKQGGKFHHVPMIDPCFDLLKRLERNGEYVFTYEGRRIKSVKTAWKAACRRAGVKGLRIHDLRHTCASMMVQNGTPIGLIKEILGHADIKTTMRYAHHVKTAEKAALENAFMAQNWLTKKPITLKEAV